ncbi:MAG: hypothetical protein ACI8PZ_005078 [Myxococcota bacterium]|jgi:hypothetical protein
MSRSVLVAAVLLAACGTPDSEPTVRVVAPGVGGEWDDPSQIPTFRDIDGTIQDAIDAAGPGAVIAVQSGTFVENVVMRDGITVRGAGPGETIIEGTVLFLGVDDAALERLSVVNAGVPYEGDGVLIEDSVSTKIDDVEVSGFNWGIRSYQATGVYVNASTLQFNNYGYWSDESTSLTIQNNLFRSNAISGVTNYTSDGVVAYNTLVGNAFAGSAEFEFGGALQFGGLDELETVANNIVVSNFYGINCQECGNRFTNNLVWGNSTDYINDAAQMGDDITTDPQFANPAEFDYSLTIFSPAIDDANSAWATVVDRDGEARPVGRGYDVGMDEFSISDFDLRISEVMANARVETVGEFVELYNFGGAPIDLAGLIITDGDDIDTLMAFEAGSTVIAPGTFAVIVDPDYDGTYEIDGGVTVVTTMDTNIGNGLTTSDNIELFEADGETTISTFSYPKDPGDGVSMEMFSLALGDVSGNWRFSECADGSSPGFENCFPPSGDPMGLIITEVMANATDEGSDEYVELFNPTDTVIDAAGLIITDGDSPDPLQGFANSSTLIGPGEHALILDPSYRYYYYIPNNITLLTTDDLSIGDGLAAASDPVTLLLADGVTVIDTYGTPVNPGDGYSMEKIDYAAPDSPDNWANASELCTRGRSPGLPNVHAGGTCDQLIINEVLANAFVEDTGEFVEIANVGFDPVDLEGMLITDGNQIDTLTAYDGGSSLLDPLRFAIVIDAEFAGDFDIPEGTVVMTTTDTHIGNGLAISDDVDLLLGDFLIDSYHFPFNAGNGISVERIWDRATDAKENWVAAPCPSGSSPGLNNCALGGDAGGAGDSLLTIVVTEVLANALDEDTGEFVEIYNYGADPIDLEGFVLWDGDAIDLLFGWWYPDDTLLMPGQYAVILDNEYDYAYDIPEDALMLTTGDTTLGSGLSTDDQVFLFEADGSTLIDSLGYPANPGNGVSLEKVDILGGDLLSNWAPCECEASISPGDANCF